MNLYHAQPSHNHDNVLASNTSEAESSPFIKEKKMPTVIVRALYYYIYTHTVSFFCVEYTLYLLINYIS